MPYLTLLHIFLFSFFTPPPETAVSTKIKYVILHDGKQIGEIKATRTGKDNQVVYESELNMTIKIIMKQDIYYTSRALYQNGMFMSSVAKSYLNNKLHHTCVTQWKGRSYEIRRDKDKTQLSKQVTYSGAMLYFREPAGVSLAYSEMSGYENRITKTGDHQYALTDSKTNKQNKYWYKGGILDHAFLNHTLIDFEIQRVN